MKLKTLQFVVVMLIALALVPVGAHLLARSNKIGMPANQYFTAQAIYLGWGLPSGIVLVAAIVASLILTIVVHGQGARFWLSLTAFVLLAATLAIYFIWTEPANRATNNWTFVPDNWGVLRTQWETSHSVNAVLTLIALGAAVLSTLVERTERSADELARGDEPARVG